MGIITVIMNITMRRQTVQYLDKLNKAAKVAIQRSADNPLKAAR